MIYASSGPERGHVQGHLLLPAVWNLNMSMTQSLQATNSVRSLLGELEPQHEENMNL